MSVPNKPFWLSAAGAEVGVGKPFWASNGTIRGLAGVGIPYWVSSLAGKSAAVGVSINASGSGNSRDLSANVSGGNGSYSYDWEMSDQFGTVSPPSSGASSLTVNRGGGNSASNPVNVVLTVSSGSYSASTTFSF